MKLHVDDLITRRREVRVPEKCPKCGADLLQEGSIKVWEYQDQSRSAHLLDVDDHSIEFEEDQPQQGEAWLMLSYQCMKCDHELAAARSEELCSESLGDEMEDFFAMKGQKHLLVQKLKGMRDAIEAAKEVLGKRACSEAEPGEEPTDHIEILRHHLIGGWGYTIDLIEDMCKDLLKAEVEDGP